MTLIGREPIGQGGKLNKKVIWVFLFAISIPLRYLNLISTQFSDFEDALEFHSRSGIPIHLTAFQQCTAFVVELFYDALIIAVAVSLLYYFLKGLPTYVGLLFGLLSRYLGFLGALLVSCLHSPMSFFRDSTDGLDWPAGIFLSLEFLLTLIFSYIGAIYGQRARYFDPRDRDLCYLGGVPKKIWFLLLITFWPVAQFLSKLTIVQIYDATGKITSMAFWKDTFSLSNLLSEDSARGVTGLLGDIIGIMFAWGLAVALFSFGLHAIRNKEVQHRWLRICAVFVFLPAVIIIVPVLRNRTWFF